MHRHMEMIAKHKHQMMMMQQERQHQLYRGGLPAAPPARGNKNKKTINEIIDNYESNIFHPGTVRL